MTISQAVENQRITDVVDALARVQFPVPITVSPLWVVQQTVGVETVKQRKLA